jgi:hypothetical protein
LVLSARGAICWLLCIRASSDSEESPAGAATGAIAGAAGAAVPDQAAGGAWATS